MGRRFMVLGVGIVFLIVGSTAVAATRLVPSQYPNIQSAISASSDGDKVIVDPNTYTGEGNKNLDFLGRKITVKSRRIRFGL